MAEDFWVLVQLLDLGEQNLIHDDGDGKKRQGRLKHFVNGKGQKEEEKEKKKKKEDSSDCTNRVND